MVKVVELSVAVQGYTAQRLFDLVYGADGAFLRQFHRTVNGDPYASIGEWEDDERSVAFTTPVNAPAFIKRVIGKDAIRVVEVQRRAFHPDGTITLRSRPVPDMPGGGRFTTEAVTTLCNTEEGCRVHAIVECSASGPYGLTGTIEAFMADAGQKSLQEFFDAVVQYAQAPQALAELAVPAAIAPPSPPTPPQAAEPEPAAAFAAAVQGVAQPPAADEAEQFWDAMELPSAPSGRSALGFEESALLYLRYMCRTGDQTVGLLQTLEQQVRTLKSEVAELRKAQGQLQQQRRWLPELPERVSTRTALLGAALLASSSAAMVLVWTRRR